jgi:CHAD domain-containing protein
MRSNEKDTTGSTRTGRQVRLVFDRITRHASRLSKPSSAITAAISDVHRFRTNSRRVEALIGELTPESRNKKKLLKLLARLRKKAGKLRDLDVEISFLQNLRIPDRHNHRAQLTEWLKSEQAKRTRKLPASFDSGTVRELRKRLRRSVAEMKLERIDALKLAISHLPRPGNVELNEKTLHACRIAAKHARYLAELADSAEAKAFVEQLKSAQDEIGEWHDVMKLKEKAERRFGSVHDSPLVAALENISRASFRRARLSLLAALAELSKRQTSPGKKLSSRKPASSDSAAPTVAVA